MGDCSTACVFSGVTLQNEDVYLIPLKYRANNEFYDSGGAYLGNSINAQRCLSSFYPIHFPIKVKIGDYVDVEHVYDCKHKELIEKRFPDEPAEVYLSRYLRGVREQLYYSCVVHPEAYEKVSSLYRPLDPYLERIKELPVLASKVRERDEILGNKSINLKQDDLHKMIMECMTNEGKIREQMGRITGGHDFNLSKFFRDFYLCPEFDTEFVEAYISFYGFLTGMYLANRTLMPSVIPVQYEDHDAQMATLGIVSDIIKSRYGKYTDDMGYGDFMPRWWSDKGQQTAYSNASGGLGLRP